MLQFEKILIQLEPIIEELSKVIDKEVNQQYAEEMWLNISTSTKLFVSAAMYVGSFMYDYVRLFYIDASNYTVDELLIQIFQTKITVIRFFHKDITSITRYKFNSYLNVTTIRTF